MRRWLGQNTRVRSDAGPRFPRTGQGRCRAADLAPGEASLSQTPPYTTGLLIHVAPWSRCPASTDLTGDNVADGVACGSVENLAAALNYANQVTGAKQPVRRAVGDYSYFEFDGAGDFVTFQSDLSGSALYFAALWRGTKTEDNLAIAWGNGAMPLDYDGFSYWIEDRNIGGVLPDPDTYRVGIRRFPTEGDRRWAKEDSYTTNGGAVWHVAEGGHSGTTTDLLRLGGVDLTPYDDLGQANGPVPYAPAAGRPLVIGASPDGTFSCQMRLAHLLVFDHLPTTPNQDAIAAWLAGWQTELALSG